ncbi:FAKD4 protein, partial [Asarcornis scutulata]|nr:FAKD4 protein [Asarcornis scutulata]
MAARLVGRCCWRRLAAISLGPGPASGLRHPPRASSLHAPGAAAEGSAVKEKAEENRGAGPRALRELLEAAQGPRELLELSEEPGLSSNQASLVISRLSRLAAQQQLEAQGLLQDPRFKQLLGVMDSQISQVWNNTLVNVLKSLYSLGLQSSSREMQSVEHEVLWRLRRLTFRQLASLAEFLASRPQKDSKLLAEVVRKLELRWTELEGTRSVVTLMAKVGHVSPALMDRLEDKALELAEQFGPEDIRKITLALAYQNRRCVPLLRALSYHLLQKHTELSLATLTDLIFAYGKLNFHQPQVFQKLATDLQPHVATMTPGEVTRCIRSFALLKWLSLPLFEAIAQYALDNAKQLSVAHLCSIILSFARLNFQPSGSEDFFNMVHEELRDQLAGLEPQLLTDLVWSLCVLQQAKPHYLQQALAPDFCARIQADPSPKAQNLRVKLLHINAAARLENPEYGGPFLAPNIWGTAGSAGEGASQLQGSLREALTGVLGSQDRARFDAPTIYGWQIDAEVVVNAENKPLPIKDFAAPHLLHAEGTKPLPPGARRLGLGAQNQLGAELPPSPCPLDIPFSLCRVAFLRWEFPNFSNRGKELLGRYAMARRHVQAAGFLVVDVS